MKNLLKTISTVAISGVLLSTSSNAQEPAEPAKPNKEAVQKLAQTFQKLLMQGLAFKDEDAVRIMTAAQENNGQLKVTPQEMKDLVEKWQKTSIPARFQRLFLEKVAAQEANALELQKEMKAAKAGTQELEMTPDRMVRLVNIWEEQNAKAEEKEEEAPAAK